MSINLAVAYDQDGRPTSMVTTDAGTDVHDLAFAYDLASQITGITDGSTPRNPRRSPMTRSAI